MCNPPLPAPPPPPPQHLTWVEGVPPGMPQTPAHHLAVGRPGKAETSCLHAYVAAASQDGVWSFVGDLAR